MKNILVLSLLLVITFTQLPSSKDSDSEEIVFTFNVNPPQAS